MLLAGEAQRGSWEVIVSSILGLILCPQGPVYTEVGGLSSLNRSFRLLVNVTSLIFLLDFNPLVSKLM